MMQSSVLNPEDEHMTQNIPSYRAVVLILGESQSGKSTFIRKLFELAGQTPPPMLQTGNSVSACTNETSRYKICLPIQEWSLATSNGEEIDDMHNVEFNREKFFELAYNRDLTIKKREKSHMFELTLIDTPGLKGDDYCEAQNMKGLLKELSSVKAINSIAFLEGGSNYGPTLLSTLQYYQNLIGRGSAFDVFHTKYSADTHLQFLEEEIKKGNLTDTGPLPDVPSVSDYLPLHPRQSHFYWEFSGWQHWFTDAHPLNKFKFREWLFHYTIKRWVLSLSTKKPIPVGNLPFYKTKDMTEIDNLVLMHNNAKLAGHVSGLSEKGNERDQVLITLSEKDRAIKRKETESRIVEVFLTEWDNKNEVFIGSNNVAVDWKWFRGTEVDLTVRRTPYPIMTVVKAIQANSVCKFAEESETPYGEKKDCRDYSIKVCSKIFRGCYASVSVFTFRKEVKSDEIVTQRQRRIQLECDIKELKEDKEKYMNQATEIKETAEKLERLVHCYTQANTNIALKEISVNFYNLVSEKGIYDLLKNSVRDGSITDENLIKEFNDLYIEKYEPVLSAK